MTKKLVKKPQTEDKLISYQNNLTNNKRSKLGKSSTNTIINQNNQAMILDNCELESQVKSPFEMLVETFDSVNKIKDDVNLIKYQQKYANNQLDDIHNIVVKNKRKQKKTLPLREPITNDIYFQLFEIPLQQNERRLQYYRFRIAITLLWATGLRLNEIRQITKDDLQQIIDTQTLQVLQTKTNKYRTIFVNKGALQQFKKLKKDINEVFYKQSYLAGKANTNTWIHFINNRLKSKAKQLNLNTLNIKSHSFRVNFVTSLLKHAPLQEVSQLVGHSDIKTTVKYDRNYLNKEQAFQLLDKAFKNND